MSNSDHVAMYCMAVFWRRLVYSSIVKNPASSLAVASKVYFHFLSGVIPRIRTIIHLSTWA